jgi:hypothetical protein
LCEFDQFTDEFIQHCVKTNVAPDPPSSIVYLDHSGKPVKVNMPGKGARNLNYTEYAALSASVWKGAVFETTAVPNIGDGCYYNPVSVHMILPRGFVYKLDKGESMPSLSTPFDDVYSFMQSYMQGRRVGEVDHVKEAMVDMDCDYSAVVGDPDAMLGDTDDVQRAKRDRESESLDVDYAQDAAPAKRVCGDSE